MELGFEEKNSLMAMCLWGNMRLIGFGIVCVQRIIHLELNSIFAGPSPLDMNGSNLLPCPVDLRCDLPVKYLMYVLHHSPDL